MQAMPSIVEADRRCHHASGDAQMGRLFPDDSLERVVPLQKALDERELLAAITSALTRGGPPRAASALGSKRNSGEGIWCYCLTRNCARLKSSESCCSQVPRSAR